MAQIVPTRSDLPAALTLEELRAAAYAPRSKMSLGDAQRGAAQARAMKPSLGILRVAVVHTYTSDLLDPWLDYASALEGFDLAVHHAPYGLALGEARAGSALARFAPDVTLLLLQAADLDPALAAPIAALDAEARAKLAHATGDRLIGLAEAFRAHLPGRIVATLLPNPFAPDLGFYDAQSEAGERGWWAGIKARVGEAARERLAATTYLDLDEVLSEIGREAFFDRRYWYSARFPFGVRAAAEIARRVIALGVVAKRPRVKVLALDADNTLWGGVIGEDGMEGIALGPDYPGNCYVDFQRRLLGLQQRGFLLALCSKNNPADIEQVLREHPHMLLREGHFAAMRVNWRPKIDNLGELAEILSLGLDSFVLIDDSDYEVQAVRRELPQVEVIRTPSRAVDVPFCLDKVARLEVLALTAEDRKKTAMYAAERERRELKRTLESDGIDLGAYLRSLDMRMRVGIDEAAQLKRLSQLTQKTNQFNLTTRRYDEAQMKAMIDDPAWTVGHFSLTDSFGDSGLVGLALIDRPDATTATLDTFLMSCRVIGREAEGAFLAALLQWLANAGVRVVRAEFIPTAKNMLAKHFLTAHGFTAVGDGQFIRDLATQPPAAADAFPIAVDLAHA